MINANFPSNFLRIFRKFILYFILLFANAPIAAELRLVTDENEQGSFPLVSHGKAAPIYISSEDFSGVHKVANHLQTDIYAVTGSKPLLIKDSDPTGAIAVIVGTLGNHSILEQLANEGKINSKEVAGKWDTFGIQVVENPFPNLDQALVIFGSNKRGTLYGMYELSRHIGVSPWYWWADAPVQKKKQVYVKAGFHSLGEPKIKYRGIFINDEAPALRNWAKEKFGGHNHKFYDHVFELILRNRGNYLWPAMWLPMAFYEDDPENAALADEYGIVMATSHHEPMTRAHDEWSRADNGPWNYETNKGKLQEFWRGGIERMGDKETVVTIGMRGDGDEAMSEETAVDLLKTIIKDQRKILSDVTGKPPNEIPQVWALYKEVQDYYERGMRVDEDILILFSDDNWGNVRILPNRKDRNYPGGYGMYYHVDYVGAPVSYRWLNTSQIERIWEQMTLSYQWGIKDLWIVNVGDIKPMELPISFFLDLAWDPDAITANDLPKYYVDWAAQQFGMEHAEEIAELLALYTKYNARRTPEMLKSNTYSIENYREADRIVDEYKQLLEKARKINQKIPKSHRAAFYQLVLYPIEACSNINEMYVAAGKNEHYALRGVPIANFYADKVEKHFKRDAELEQKYHQLNDGKWNHMMSQTRMGYTYWNHPPLNRTPPVTKVEVGEQAELGYFIENGPAPRWGWLDVEADWSFSTVTPEFHSINNQEYFIEVVNRGRKALAYTIKGKEAWIKLSKTGGKVQQADKVFVSIDWDKAPKGKSEGEITIAGAGSEYKIKVPIVKESMKVAGFVENNGVVSIESKNFQKANNQNDARWIVVPNLGRTGSSVMPYPANITSRNLESNAPSLKYTFTLLKESEIYIETFLSPTHNFKQGDGLKFAISIDDAEPEIINLNENEDLPDWKYAEWWMKAVADHIKIKRSSHGIVDKGVHTLKVWMIDPGVVIQKLVIDAGGLKESYLGPPESAYIDIGKN